MKQTFKVIASYSEGSLIIHHQIFEDSTNYIGLDKAETLQLANSLASIVGMSLVSAEDAAKLNRIDDLEEVAKQAKELRLAYDEGWIKPCAPMDHLANRLIRSAFYDLGKALIKVSNNG